MSRTGSYRPASSLHRGGASGPVLGTARRIRRQAGGGRSREHPPLFEVLPDDLHRNGCRRVRAETAALTMTPPAITGLLAGANQVNTASSRSVVLLPFCAVPVLPAISTPATFWLAVAYAVPAGLFVTEIIIWVSWLATVALIGFPSSCGVVVCTGLRSGACTSLTRDGAISVPPVAMVGGIMASCSGVPRSLNWPMAW